MIDKKEISDEIIYDTCSGFANSGDMGKRMIEIKTAEQGINEFITMDKLNNK